MRRAAFPARLLWLACAGMVLAGCSFTRLAYDNVTVLYGNAAPMLTWMVDDYVDISGDQKDWVRERFALALAWHRRQELPEYRRFLERVAARFEGNFTAEEVSDSYRELRAHYHRAAEHLLPDVADFLLQLDGEQVAQLERRFEDDNRKVAKEATRRSVEERGRERAAKLCAHFEEWTGALDARQRERVAASVRTFADLAPERLADRRYRQSAVLELLRARAGKERMVAQLRRLLIDTDGWRQPEYQERLRGREAQMFDLIASLSATLAPAQREHLVRRLRGFIRDIGTLTAST